ncbi:ATPase [Niabella ginsenosidivorans]|uniref:ATPase n=1 Tax=Niabella ginsenosidivorans TaxID=1176587 RepID=A0A1A9I399_9BACT|nr:SRPBCC family protein [Niabella ginsenosidivorans]ANH82096.1 ATPase [Niabella ginsenosidivorans]
MKNSTQNFKNIKAPAKQVYEAIMNPRALEQWMAPGNMRGKVHSFDGRAGGGYKMSLYYSSSGTTAPGKTSSNEDRFHARFIELVPGKKIVQAIRFESDNPAFEDEMTMSITLTEQETSTLVSILFENIPEGILPEDNETGTASSLDKLAAYIESRSSG